MKPLHIAILAGLAVFMVALGVNFSQSASIYTDFATAKRKDKQVHIVGQWVDREAAHYDAAQDLFSFYVKDTTQRVELVKYYDPMPVNFEQAEKVVLIGAYDQDAFVAEKIVMKCPSKYEPTQIQQ
ncbi:MAG: cytochrome c maturation protein CcmE [Bacteroidia bacterium]|nr:cytochrome c maturation protein CcmE [Bacteroidia bacterium]